MAVKIRLTRVGRTHDAHYRIVAADSRYSRDGRFIEQIGHYDPKSDLKSAVINRELALKWLNNGAQPSETVKSLFRAHGINAEFAKSKATGK